MRKRTEAQSARWKNGTEIKPGEDEGHDTKELCITLNPVSEYGEVFSICFLIILTVTVHEIRREECLNLEITEKCPWTQ